MNLPVVLDLLVAIPALLWSGGLLVLGAVVAPVVFHSGDPRAADLMTAIFGRFDTIAAVCAVALVASEAVSLAVQVDRSRRVRIVRLGLAGMLGACALIQGAWLTPTIRELHAHGVVRGVGDAGLRFERMHRASESVGKFTVFANAALAGLVVATARRNGVRAPRE